MNATMNATMNTTTPPPPVRAEVRVPNAPLKKRPMEEVESSNDMPASPAPLHPPPIPKRIHF